MPPDISRPWHAMVAQTIYEVAKGSKPISCADVEVPEDQVRLFVEQYVATLPTYSKKPIVRITRMVAVPWTTVMVTSDARLLDVYDEASGLPMSSKLRHFIMGTLYGYGMREILDFIDYVKTRPSK